ncbi:hypothetical protein BKA57DRAFT_510949 [Linnemannia elongata]|nr:hypothetical protein BKA57DRAFT_510949 [Linnemannia elongata]
MVDASTDRIPEADPGDVAGQNNLNKIKDCFSCCMCEATILEAGLKPLMVEMQSIKMFLSASDSLPDKRSLSKKGSSRCRNVLTVDEYGLGLQEVEDYMDSEQLQRYIEATATMLQLVLGYEDVAAEFQSMMSQNFGHV